MARLIRMDRQGTRRSPNGPRRTTRLRGGRGGLRRELEQGWIATVPDGPGKATHVREFPADADLVILRRPISGG